MTDLKHNFWSVKSWVKDVLLLKKHKKIILLEKEKTSQIFFENSELIVSIVITYFLSFIPAITFITSYKCCYRFIWSGIMVDPKNIFSVIASIWSILDVFETRYSIFDMLERSCAIAKTISETPSNPREKRGKFAYFAYLPVRIFCIVTRWPLVEKLYVCIFVHNSIF